MACDGREAGTAGEPGGGYRLTGDRRSTCRRRGSHRGFFLKVGEGHGTFSTGHRRGRQHHCKLITGYGDWSSFAGLAYRCGEVTGERFLPHDLVLLRQAIQPRASR